MTTIKPEPLKPCPFCGNGGATVGRDSAVLPLSHWWSVECGNPGCLAYIHGKTEAEALAAWNRRTPSASEIEARVYNDLHAYYQDLLLPGHDISRSELLARLGMLADQAAARGGKP